LRTEKCKVYICINNDDNNNNKNNNYNNNNNSTVGKIILIQKVNKQTQMRSGNTNMVTKNYITQNIRSMKKK
jgi:hypothetical protein